MLVVVHRDNLVVVIKAPQEVVLDILHGLFKVVLVQDMAADQVEVLDIGVDKVVLIFVVLLLLVAVVEARIFIHQ